MYTPKIGPNDRAKLLQEIAALQQQLKALDQPNAFGGKPGDMMQASGTRQEPNAGAGAQGVGQPGAISGGGVNPYVAPASPAAEVKLGLPGMERASGPQINGQQMMSAPGHGGMHQPNLYRRGARPLEENEPHHTNPSNPYAAEKALTEQIRKQAEMERKREQMSGGYGGIQMANPNGGMSAEEQGKMYSQGPMSAGQGAMHTHAGDAVWSLEEKERRLQRKSEELNNRRPTTGAMGHEGAHAPAEDRKDEPLPAWAQIAAAGLKLYADPDADVAPELSEGLRRLFVDRREEPEGQPPQPTINAAMKRPLGRLRMEYTAQKAPGARGYFIVGQPNAGLMVSGAQRVGPDTWYVPPGTVFSIEGPHSKNGAGGYRIIDGT